MLAVFPYAAMACSAGGSHALQHVDTMPANLKDCRVADPSQYVAMACWAAAAILGVSFSLLCLRLKLLRIRLRMGMLLPCLPCPSASARC